MTINATNHTMQVDGSGVLRHLSEASLSVAIPESGDSVVAAVLGNDLSDGFYNASGQWKTSFDYGQECTMAGEPSGANTDCEDIQDDGIDWDRDTDNVGGNYSECVVAGNNGDGDGGMCARFWVGDGTNAGSGKCRITFAGNRQTEFWHRWYMRYESGFAWSGGEPNYDKTFYWFVGPTPGTSPFELLTQYSNPGFGLYTQGGAGQEFRGDTDIKWTDVFGSTSDGLYHMFEVYFKMDTDQTDGIGRFWIDGDLIVDEEDVDWSGGNSEIQAGFRFVEFHNNQENPANGGPAYVDYDDIEMWKVTPPNTDPVNGYPWIGPLNGFSGGS